MFLGDIPLMSLVKTRLNYHGQRQAVIAQNVANIDTPHYRAKDIQSPDFAGMVAAASHNLAMMRTSAAHLPTSVTGTLSRFDITNRATTDELNPNDNNVSVEQEMYEASSNQSQYNRALSILSKSMALMKLALGRNGG